jgi:hypothetical protein
MSSLGSPLSSVSSIGTTVNLTTCQKICLTVGLGICF